MSLTLAFLPVLSLPLLASQTIVSDTTYPGLFAPPDDVTVVPAEIPDGTLLGVQLDGSASGALGTFWTAQANGGAVLGSNLLGDLIGEVRVAETGAQVELTGDALEFNISNSPASILGALGVGLGVTLDWTATAKFNAVDHQLTLAPNTTYHVSFDVVDGSGLLNSALAITPTFSVALLDGANATVGTLGGGAPLLNLVGLPLAPVVGAPAGTGRVNAEFRTGSSVSAAPASLRFKGSAILPASVGGIGTNFATVSNLTVIVVDPYSAWVDDNDLTVPADQLPGADPDHDGKPNIQEFALATDPASGSHGDVTYTVADPDGGGSQTSAFIMTLPVRSGAEFSTDSGDKVATRDGATYRVEGSFDLVTWAAAVSEVTPNTAFASGLPTLPSGWEYRSFRVPGETSDTRRAFLRVIID